MQRINEDINANICIKINDAAIAQLVDRQTLKRQNAGSPPLECFSILRILLFAPKVKYSRVGHANVVVPLPKVLFLRFMLYVGVRSRRHVAKPKKEDFWPPETWCHSRVGLLGHANTVRCQVRLGPNR